MISDLQDDLRYALAALPVAHAKFSNLELLEEAIHRDIYFIAEYPTMLFECLWNTCWWDNSAERMSRGTFGVNGSDELRISLWLERWRKDKRALRHDFSWVRSLRAPALPLDGSRTIEFSEDSTPIVGIAFFADDQYLIVVRRHGTISIYEVSTGRRRVKVVDDGQSIGCMCILPKHRLIACGDRSGAIRLLEIETCRERACLVEELLVDAHCIATSSDETRIVVGYARDKVRVWNVDTLHAVAALDEVENKRYSRSVAIDVRSLAFSPDGQTIAIGTGIGVCLWRYNDAQRVTFLERSEEGDTKDAHFSSDGGLVVAGCRDGTIRIWQIAGLRMVHVLTGHNGPVTATRFLPSSHRVISGSGDRTVRVWDPESKAPDTLMFSERYLMIATGEDKAIWGEEDGKELKCLAGHSGAVADLVVSSNGQYVASLSDDGKIHLSRLAL